MNEKLTPETARALGRSWSGAGYEWAGEWLFHYATAWQADIERLERCEAWLDLCLRSMALAMVARTRQEIRGLLSTALEPPALAPDGPNDGES